MCSPSEGVDVEDLLDLLDERSQPKTTEDSTFRLFGLKWTGADAGKLREAADQLLALLQADGGWAQIRSRSADVYATAEALVALHQAGGIRVDNPVWRRGVKYLMRRRTNANGNSVEPSPPLPETSQREPSFPIGISSFAGSKNQVTSPTQGQCQPA